MTDKKKQMTKDDAARIQRKVDKGEAKKADEAFKKKAQSSADKNENEKNKP